MWYLRNMGGVGQFFWFGVWDLLVLCGLVGDVLWGFGAVFGVVRWEVVLDFFVW